MLAPRSEGGARMLQTYRCIDEKNAFYQYILGNRSHSEPQFSGVNYWVSHNQQQSQSSNHHSLHHDPITTAISDSSSNNQVR